jgi:DNA-binding transcriptional LysR family regulator
MMNSLRDLQFFVRAARCSSFAEAARAMDMTPQAASAAMKRLERDLGVKLFARNDFALSAEGAAYLAQVRQGLQALQQVPGPGAGSGTTRLRLAVTPTFSRQMLMPRLALFRHAFPDVELILQVSIPLADTKAEDADLEIRYGSGPYAGVEQERILVDQIVPACSPEYLHEAGPFEGFDTLEQVGRARLIRSPLEPWNTWFAACGIALPEPREGSQFNDVGLMLDAAAAGFGVTLLRLRLGHEWLDSGRLVRLSPRSVASPHHHFLCWKPGAMQRWECAAFADWLRQSLA